MVPTAFTANSQFQIDLRPLAANVGLNPTLSPQSWSTSTAWTFGTSAGQINEGYLAVRTLAASATETLDLIGVLTGLFGETLSFTKIKEIIISLLQFPAAASSITVGGAASNPWLGPLSGTTPKITVTSGDTWHQTRSDATGWAVTGASAENLKVANNDSGNAATYFIALLGCA